MSLNTWRHQGPCKPSSCTTFTLNSHWAELPQAKKKKKKKVLCLCALGHLGPVQFCNPVDCGLPDFSVREGLLQARILECIGQYWLPYLSRTLYFLLP